MDDHKEQAVQSIENKTVVYSVTTAQNNDVAIVMDEANHSELEDDVDNETSRILPVSNNITY